ncbi:MAG: CrcB protein [Algoriphagus sp.]
MSKTLLYIFLGGGFGSIARYLISKFSAGTLGNGLPYGTLLANILASLLLGYLTAKTFQSENIWKPMLTIGFCGGFSTFSTFSNETFKLLQNAEYSTAMLNISFNLMICLVAIWAGMMLGK